MGGLGGDGGQRKWGCRCRGLQEQSWNGARGQLTRLGSEDGVVGLGGLREGLALALLQDVQTLPQAAECGCRGGLKQQQVLVQAGQGTLGGQRVDGVDQVLLLALCLGHHLGTEREGAHSGWDAGRGITISEHE